MNIDTFMKYCRFPQDTKINVYQSGSHVYGTATPESDYDFFAVVTDEFFEQIHQECQIENSPWPFASQWNPPTSKSGTEYDENYYDGYRCLYVFDDKNQEINVNLFNKSTFEAKLDENWLQALQCIYLPSQNIWRYDLKDINSDNVIIHSKNIVRSIVNEQSKHFHRVKQKWYQNRKLAKKNLVYAIRGLMFGIQIAKYDRIVDYTQANELYYSLLADQVEDVVDMENKYKPLYQELRDEFNRLVVKERMMIADSDHDGGSPLLRYLNKCDFVVDNLQRFLSLQISYDQRYKHLVHVRDTINCTNAAPVVVECGNGVVIDTTNRTIVSYPFTKVLEWNDKHAQKVEIRNITVMNRRPKHLSPIVTMYHYEGRWRVSSEYTPDGSDILRARNDQVQDTILSNEFWRLFGNYPLPTDSDKCYVFIMDLYDWYTVTDDEKNENSLLDRYDCTSGTNTVKLFTVMDRINHIEIDPLSYASELGWELYGNHMHGFSRPWVLEHYTSSLDPLQIGFLFMTWNGIRVMQTNPQRTNLLLLLSSYPQVPDDAEMHMVDMVRCTLPYPDKMQVFEKFIKNYELLVPLFERVCSKYGKLISVIDQLYTDLYDEKDSQIMKNLGKLDISNLFDNVGPVKKLLTATLMSIKKKIFSVPHGIEITNTGQFYAHRASERCCYPTLYNSLKLK